MSVNMQFADFNNFVAFGEFVSIDLRVKVRNMVTGRPVKTFSVNTKLPEYNLQGRFYSEVGEALDKCIADLVRLVKKEGFTLLADALESRLIDDSHLLWHDATSHLAERLRQLMALNHEWDTEGSCLSWVQS